MLWGCVTSWRVTDGSDGLHARTSAGTTCDCLLSVTANYSSEQETDHWQWWTSITPPHTDSTSPSPLNSPFTTRKFHSSLNFNGEQGLFGVSRLENGTRSYVQQQINHLIWFEVHFSTKIWPLWLMSCLNTHLLYVWSSLSSSSRVIKTLCISPLPVFRDHI